MGPVVVERRGVPRGVWIAVAAVVLAVAGVAFAAGRTGDSATRDGSAAGSLSPGTELDPGGVDPDGVEWSPILDLTGTDWHLARVGLPGLVAGGSTDRCSGLGKSDRERVADYLGRRTVAYTVRAGGRTADLDVQPDGTVTVRNASGPGDSPAATTGRSVSPDPAEPAPEAVVPRLRWVRRDEWAAWADGAEEAATLAGCGRGSDVGWERTVTTDESGREIEHLSIDVTRGGSATELDPAGSPRVFPCLTGRGLCVALVETDPHPLPVIIESEGVQSRVLERLALERADRDQQRFISVYALYGQTEGVQAVVRPAPEQGAAAVLAIVDVPITTTR